MTAGVKISIVMPVYNEAGTIEEIVSRVLASAFEKELIIVDDGSTDGTRRKLEEIVRSRREVKVLTHGFNRGKGAALRTGFSAVTGDIVVIQDADLEYNPAEYPGILGPLFDGRGEIVFGSRLLGGRGRTIPFWQRAGNRAVTFLSNRVNGLHLTDMETCYKAFWKRVLDGLVLRSDRFAFEAEFTAKVARKGFRICEVPIGYSGRSYSQGKKARWRDGVEAVLSVFWFRFFT